MDKNKLSLLLVLLALAVIGCTKDIMETIPNKPPIEQAEEIMEKWEEEKEYFIAYEIETSIFTRYSTYHLEDIEISIVEKNGKGKIVMVSDRYGVTYYPDEEEIISCVESRPSEMICIEPNMFNPKEKIEESASSLKGTVLPGFKLTDASKVTAGEEKEIAGRKCKIFKMLLEKGDLEHESTLNIGDFAARSGQSSHTWREGDATYTICLDREKGFPVEIQLEVETTSTTSGIKTMPIYKATLIEYIAEVDNEEVEAPEVVSQ
mgnify:CR=1 FL=1